MAMYLLGLPPISAIGQQIIVVRIYVLKSQELT
jgi:hypothetical protein